ncbi:MAG: hypothetical protein R6V49_03065, partial [Bacteroidales bacterium]
MKKYTYVALLIFIIGGAFQVSSQIVTGWQWAKSSGGVGRDEAELPAVDPSGNVIVCGKFSDTAWFGTSYLVSSGLLDMYLAKYNIMGNLQWAVKGGSAGNAEALSIAADKMGNVAVTGYFKGVLNFNTIQLTGSATKENFFVAKFDSLGNLLWAKHAIGGNIRGKGVEFDPAGDVLV